MWWIVAKSRAGSPENVSSGSGRSGTFYYNGINQMRDYVTNIFSEQKQYILLQYIDDEKNLTRINFSQPKPCIFIVLKEDWCFFCSFHTDLQPIFNLEEIMYTRPRLLFLSFTNWENNNFEATKITGYFLEIPFWKQWYTTD